MYSSSEVIGYRFKGLGSRVSAEWVDCALRDTHVTSTGQLSDCIPTLILTCSARVNGAGGINDEGMYLVISFKLGSRVPTGSFLHTSDCASDYPPPPQNGTGEGIQS